MGNERNASSGKRKAKAFPISLTIANPVGAPQPGDQHLMDTEKGTRDLRTGNDIFGGAGSLLQRITTESTRRVEERKRKRLMDDSFGPDATKQKTVEVGQDETTVPSSRSGGSGSGGQLEESRTPQAPVGMPVSSNCQRLTIRDILPCSKHFYESLLTIHYRLFPSHRKRKCPKTIDTPSRFIHRYET